MDPDQALLDRWRAGDATGGRELVDRYFKQIYRFFANKCGEPDELAQATFLAIVKARDQFLGRSSFRTYLFTIAYHELHRHLRVLQRERKFDPELSSIAEIITTPASRIARNEDHRRLCEALRTLPVEQQTLLELHYWDDLDTAALAEIFDIDAAAVRARLYRARNSLREAMLATRAAPEHALVSVEDLDTWARTMAE